MVLKTKKKVDYKDLKEYVGKYIEFLFDKPYINQNENKETKEKFWSYSIEVNVYDSEDAEKPEETRVRVNIPTGLMRYGGRHIGLKNRVKVVENKDGYLEFEGPTRKSTPAENFLKKRGLESDELSLLFEVVKDANKYMDTHIEELVEEIDEETKQAILSKIRVSFRF